ncbi:MAG: hypothetical protein ABWY77_07955 [Acidimicrobiia bacterium]
MAIDERRWLELADAARRALGDGPGTTLMELLREMQQREDARDRDPIIHLSTMETFIGDQAHVINRRLAALGERLDRLERQVRHGARG